MSSMSSGEGLLRNAARALERVNEEVGSGGGAGSGSGSGGGGAGTGTGAGVGAGASGAVVITPGEADRVRPLEDPYLVGEEAAARARRERLARENGDDVLQREDRRWDWFLGRSSTLFFFPSLSHHQFLNSPLVLVPLLPSSEASRDNKCDC